MTVVLLDEAAVQDTYWPRVRTAVVDGFVISFGDRLTESANRAALAFRSAVDMADLMGVEETSTSLVSAYVRVDPLGIDHAEIRSALDALLKERDWYSAALPDGRRLWRVPTAFGGDAAPQLAEMAAAARLSEAEAIQSICGQQVRVQTIGFAPGGLCVAIRQLVLFPVATPTGWRQIGQTALRLFQPEQSTPCLLRPGDEVRFDAVSADILAVLRDVPNGGATSEPLS
ncbi:MAG: carboxyltransferase domain-containing protein [Pseudomonadota bacterium]